MKQIMKVRTKISGEAYVLYEEQDDDGDQYWTLYFYKDDGAGNGTLIARGYHLPYMRQLVLALGRLVEREAGVRK